MRHWEAQMGDARFEVIPEARHCPVMLAAVVGHDAGGKLARNRTARRLISRLHTRLELRPYLLRNFAGQVALRCARQRCRAARGRTRRLIFSLICSSSKAENVPKPTSVDITASQVRIASVEGSADDIQAAHEIHLVAVGSALDVWGQYLRRNERRRRRYFRRCAIPTLAS